MSVKARCPTGSPCLTNHPVRQTHALHWRGKTFLFSNHKEFDKSCAFSDKLCQTCLCMNQMMTVRLGMLVSKSKLKSVTVQKEFAIYPNVKCVSCYLWQNWHAMTTSSAHKELWSHHCNPCKSVLSSILYILWFMLTKHCRQWI